MRNNSDASTEPREDEEEATTSIFIRAALWPLTKGAATKHFTRITGATTTPEEGGDSNPT